MKFKSILSGVTAILLVSAFYIFAFGIVDEVDDTSISDEYLYVEEDSGADIHGGTFDDALTSGANEDIQEVFTGSDNQEYYVIPDTSLNNENSFDVLEEDEEPAESYEDEELFDDDDNESFNTVAANTLPDYARDKGSNVAVAKKDNPATTKPSNKKKTTTTTTAATTTKPITTTTAATTTKPITTTTAATTTKPVTTTTAATTTTPYYTTTIPYYTTTPAPTTTTPYYTTTAQTTAPEVLPIGNETFSVRLNGSVQQIDAYDLICRIVSSEMSTSFSDEALKAQAVAAYCYVKSNNLSGISPSVIASATPTDKIKSLVSSVWGVACYYDGSLAQTVYCASSAGYTSSSVNVWGGNYAYLTSVSCPFDSASDPNYGVTKVFTESEMRSCLESSLGITLTGDPSSWLNITSYVDTVYVGGINVDGQKTITGRHLRETVLGYRLKSASFDVVYSDGQFIFTTYGYGHGVGMSQNGANYLAKQGYTYVDILKYYYTGITVR